MAESSHQTRDRALTAPRWGARPIAVLAAIALFGAAAPGTPPPPPAVAPQRTRTVRISILVTDVAGLPARMLRRWITLLLALPAIGETPTSRSDTPVLPTVGRPRDVPRHVTPAAASA
jgi:hypothetical protein